MNTQRFTPEFKAEAARQVIERGYSVAETAERLGVSTHSRVERKPLQVRETLTLLKRLFELATDGKGKVAIVLIGHPKLKNDLHRPSMEEEGGRTTVFEFGGLRDRQRDYIDRMMRESLDEGVEINSVITEETATTMAARLKTPLQIGRHLVRAFEAGFEMGMKPIDATTVDTVLSQRIDDIEPQLTRHGYGVRALCTQLDVRPPEIRQLMRGTLNPQRSSELVEEMRVAGLPL